MEPMSRKQTRWKPDLEHRRAAPTPGAGEAVLAAAIQHHRAGRLRDAAALYREILKAQPDNYDALNLSWRGHEPPLAMSGERVFDALTEQTRAILSAEGILPTDAPGPDQLVALALRNFAGLDRLAKRRGLGRR